MFTYGEYAFYGCSGLTNITIPESVTEIGLSAFEYCNELSNVSFSNSSEWYIGSSKGEKAEQISSSYLADSSMAAKCLKSMYTNFYWTR